MHSKKMAVIHEILGHLSKAQGHGLKGLVDAHRKSKLPKDAGDSIGKDSENKKEGVVNDGLDLNKPKGEKEIGPDGMGEKTEVDKEMSDDELNELIKKLT